jgi:hypothetical protein
MADAQYVLKVSNPAEDARRAHLVLAQPGILDRLGAPGQRRAALLPPVAEISRERARRRRGLVEAAARPS